MPLISGKSVAGVATDFGPNLWPAGTLLNRVGIVADTFRHKLIAVAGKADSKANNGVRRASKKDTQQWEQSEDLSGALKSS